MVSAQFPAPSTASSGEAYNQSTVSPELVPYLDNEYVEDIHGNKIFYKKEFYVAMCKRIQDEHMTYVEAYESLGFHVNVLGKSRAEQAGKNAIAKAKDNKLFTHNPDSYDGGVPLEDMPNLSPEEQIAFMRKRIIYLEAMVEAQKKIQFALEGSSIR